ncbi:MAG: DUF4335 domain-containing protein [Coleofasciculaceae cyanobacterium]
MTISRQYSLPYCTLILEGLNDSNPGVGLQLESRPLMTILVNAECHLAGGALPLSGGREFLESLIKSVSSYAQQFLSKVYHPQLDKGKEAMVQLEHIKDKNLHRLTLLAGNESNNGTDGGKAALPGNTSGETVQIDLTTVQLFDLVEAVDQFLADSGTLPDIKVSLKPISKRYIKAEQPVAERAVPAAAGLASLALAAIAFFFIPIPEVREPLPEPRTKANEETLDNPQDSENSAGETVATETPTSTPSTSSETGETGEIGESREPLSAEELEKLLSSAPEINDPTEVRYLQRNLQKEIYQTWQNREPLGENLEYQVSVGRDGKIIGYRPVNDSARERSQETPLPDLLYIKPTDGVASQEPIAQFQVVFSKAGALQISPWHGYKGQANLGPEIKETAVLNNLNQQLREQLQKDDRPPTPTYPVELIYRVGITNDGVIADYEPINTPAWDYIEETPLEKLVKPDAAGIGVDGAGLVPQEPLAQFRVVFKPDGVMEVSPYRGLR